MAEKFVYTLEEMQAAAKRLNAMRKRRGRGFLPAPHPSRPAAAIVAEARRFQPRGPKPDELPDISIPYNENPFRHRWSIQAVTNGTVAVDWIERSESGEYPTVEDHLARRTPAAKPFLSLLHFCLTQGG